MASNPTQHTSKNKQPRAPNSPNQFGNQEDQNRQTTGRHDQSLDQDQQIRQTAGQGEQLDNQNDQSQTRGAKGQRGQSGTEMSARNQDQKNPGDRKHNC
ncbi:MAG: hypothetical protein ACLGHI_10485 [Gammaproteobacteria bacterium]